MAKGTKTINKIRTIKTTKKIKATKAISKIKAIVVTKMATRTVAHKVEMVNALALTAKTLMAKHHLKEVMNKTETTAA